MSNQAAIPAAPLYVFPKTGLRALPNLLRDYSVYFSPSSRVGRMQPRQAAVSADFISRELDECYVPARVSRSVSRVLFGHCFRAYPAPCGSSLFCFCSAALRVTVSFQILFGKYTEKISPDPP